MIDAVCYFNVDDTQLHLALVCILDLYDDARRQVPLHSRKSLKTRSKPPALGRRVGGKRFLKLSLSFRKIKKIGFFVHSLKTAGRRNIV